MKGKTQTDATITPPDVLSERDLGSWQLLQRAAQAAADQANACTYALETFRDGLVQKYRLAPEDTVNTSTGHITRATADPAPVTPS